MYAVNYQLAAEIQQIGIPADAKHLCDFLSLPGDSVQYHIRRAEQILGPIQILNRESSEKDTMMVEVETTKREENLEYHECTIVGHKHRPLPFLKGSYGR